MARARAFFLKRWAEVALTVLGLSLLGWAKATADTFIVNDLAGGVDDAIPGNLIADNEAVSIDNFHVDPISKGLFQRRGSSKLNSTQLSGNTAVDIFSHVQSDGDSYLIAVASKTVSYSTSNGATFTSLITTATLNAVWDGVSFVDDSFYMVNQNDGGYGFTGSAFSPAGTMPAGKFIQAYQNRLFVANTASFPYRVFFSGLLQPSTWTTSTDYFDMPESVTCVGEPFDGGLPIYTKNTTWMLRGTSPTDYYLQQVSGQIGCADNRDVQNFEIGGTEYQVFLSLGPNSSKTSLYGLLGNRVVDLGLKIPTLMSGIAIFDSSSRTEEWDITSDFNAGTFSQTYADASEEALKLSTMTRVDTSTTDFSAGTTSNTSILSNRVYLSTNDTNVSNNGFETGSTSGWTVGAGGGFSVTTNPHSGTYDGEFIVPFASFGGEASVLILDSSGNTINTQSCTFTGSYSACTISLSSFVGRWIKIRVGTRTPSNVYIENSSPFLCSGNSMTIWGEYSSSEDATQDFLELDDFTGGVSTIYSGTFTSATLDSGFSTAAWASSGANWTTNSHSITAQTQESSDGSSWDTALSWSTGTAPTDGTRKRYKRYILTLSTGGTTNGTALPYVDDVTLSVLASSGSYISDIRDAGTAISSWDIFNPNTAGGNNQSFSYRTGATTTTLVATAFTSIAAGADISGSARYIQWADTFTVVAATDNPHLDSLTINFSQSAGASQPGDMEVWNNDLWMTYTSTSSTYNSSILLMNADGKFSTLSGLTVYGFAAHNQKLLAGTSLNDGVSGGYVRQLDVGSTDDGNSVSSSVSLKQQEFPSDNQDWRKIMSHAYFNYAVASGTFTATINENFSDHAQNYTVYASSGNTIGRYRLEAVPGTTAKQFGLEFTNTYPGSRLLLYPPISYYFSKQKMIPQ